MGIFETGLGLAFISAIASGITQLGKKWNLPAIWLYAVLCVIAGAGYQAFCQFVDPEFKLKTLEFMTGMFTMGTIYYEIFLKNRKKA